MSCWLQAHIRMSHYCFWQSGTTALGSPPLVHNGPHATSMQWPAYGTPRADAFGTIWPSAHEAMMPCVHQPLDGPPFWGRVTCWQFLLMMRCRATVLQSQCMLCASQVYMECGCRQWCRRGRCRLAGEEQGCRPPSQHRHRQWCAWGA